MVKNHPMIRPAAKTAFLGLLALAMLSASIATARAAGAHTHAQCGYLAIHCHLKQVGEMLPGLERFFDDAAVRQAFYAGCAFPDWGYPGDNNHDAAEASHWRAFQLAYLERLRRDCPPPWNRKSRCRMAFFLGLLSHGLTDTPWHFDHGPHKSLLTTSREIDGANHGDTEWAAEFLSFADVRLDAPMPCMDWPMDDILAAYRAIGSNATLAQLEDGRRVLNTSWTGAQLASIVVADQYRKKYPWLARGYRDYYYGGCEHGGAVTAMAIRAAYANLNGGYCFQQKPEYACEPPALMDYAGCSDTTVFERTPGHNAGGEPFLTLAGGAGRHAMPMVRFDLSSIPADRRIQKATLWLYLAERSGTAPREGVVVEAVALEKSWLPGDKRSDPVDGAEGRPASNGEATWASFASDALNGSLDVCAATAPSDVSSSRWIAWDVTAAARRWVSDPRKNFGLALRTKDGDAVSGVAWRFHASEAMQSRPGEPGGAARLAYRPMLIVTPEP